MTDRPINFRAPMIAALLDGRKSQTRRILKPQPGVVGLGDAENILTCDEGYAVAGRAKPQPMPYAVGDRLWVREGFAFDGVMVRYYATDHVHELRRKRPSIHMPRWASRLTLTVTDVRVQRVQEISLGDICAEGLARSIYDFAPVQRGFDAWADLWISIYGPEAWAANPWVAALTFETHRCNIDQMPGGTNE